MTISSNSGAANGRPSMAQISTSPRRYSDTLTAGQAAVIAGVSVKHLNKWIDSGDLPGGRLGPGGHRRVHRDDLLRFLRARGLRPNVIGPRHLVLSLGLPPGLDAAVAAACADWQGDHLEHEPCAGLWALSRAAQAGLVRLAVLALQAGRACVLEALAGLAAELPAPPCLVLLPEDGDGKGEFARAPGVRALLLAHDPAALRAECRRLLAGE